MKLSRRDFLRLGIATGGGLALGVNLSGCNGAGRVEKAGKEGFRANAWVRVNADGSVLLVIPDVEMGQGVRTSLTMLMAEELEVDWETIRLIQAEPGREFTDLYTSGSRSIRKHWKGLRTAGATAREMLVEAAARRWGVDSRDCRAERNMVINLRTRERLGYGELAQMATGLAVPRNVTLKPSSAWRLIGGSRPMIDARDLVTGRARYGIDFESDGMLFATIVHPPVFGSHAVAFDDGNAAAVPGFRQAMKVSSGVAVLADDTWSAMRAAGLLEIEWSRSSFAEANDESIRRQYLSALDKPAEIVFEKGPPESAGGAGRRTLSAVYELPYLTHMTMEPMNCTVRLRGDQCEIWAPTQSPSGAQYQAGPLVISKPVRYLNALREKLGMEGDTRHIRVHPQLVGGGFGRRLAQDYVFEAIEIARATEHPVKLTWTREEDMQHGFYRPCSAHRLSAELDETGRPLVWRHHLAAGDRGKSLGGATGYLYDVPSVSIRYTEEKNPVPLGYWRSVGHSHNVFVIESFMDELAEAAAADPLQYRLDLLTHEPRCQQVLRKVAGMAGWSHRRARGRHLGIALMKGFGSIVAEVVEVEKADTGFRVVRVYCAVDCGTAVNRDGVVAQMEGGIIFALTAETRGHVHIRQGRVTQSNFHDSPLLTIRDTPQIDVAIIDSDESPGGIGEVAVPCLAPALANAVYSLTGNRRRNLWA